MQAKLYARYISFYFDVVNEAEMKFVAVSDVV